MKKEYKIVYIEKTNKYHILYFENGEPAINVPTEEYYGRSLDAPECDIRFGYVKHKDSL